MALNMEKVYHHFTRQGSYTNRVIVANFLYFTSAKSMNIG